MRHAGPQDHHRQRRPQHEGHALPAQPAPEQPSVIAEVAAIDEPEHGRGQRDHGQVHAAGEHMADHRRGHRAPQPQRPEPEVERPQAQDRRHGVVLDVAREELKRPSAHQGAGPHRRQQRPPWAEVPGEADQRPDPKAPGEGGGHLHGGHSAHLRRGPNPLVCGEEDGRREGLAFVEDDAFLHEADDGPGVAIEPGGPQVKEGQEGVVDHGRSDQEAHRALDHPRPPPPQPRPPSLQSPAHRSIQPLIPSHDQRRA